MSVTGSGTSWRSRFESEPIEPVRPSDFKEGEDLPIGQVLRRITERHIGVADHTISDTQGRLASHMERVARRAHQHPTLSRAAEQAAVLSTSSMHVQVGSRYLPLHVDTSFGRAAGETQELIPWGGWTYKLDAALLRLWVEEELEALQPMQLRASPTAAVGARMAPQAARPVARPMVAAASRPAIAALPPVVRQALEGRRQEVRAAVLEATRGNAAPLARLMHGAEAASMVARTAAAATATTSVVSPLAQPALRGAALPMAERSTALTPSMLRVLASREPALSVDASGRDFSFEGAAQAVRARSIALEERALLGSPSEAVQASSLGTPGQLGAQLAAQAASTQRRQARMFGLTASERAVAEQRASILGGVGPAPVAGEDVAGRPLIGAALRSAIDGTPGQAYSIGARPERAAASVLESGGVDTRSWRTEAFGQTALRALHAEELTRAVGAAEGRPSMAWLRSGGRGVLLAGLSEGAAPTARPLSAVDAYPAGLGARAAAMAPRTPVATMLPGGRGEVAQAPPLSLSSREIVQRALALVSSGAPALATALRSLGYDGAAPGDFGAMIARSLVAPSRGAAAAAAPGVTTAAAEPRPGRAATLPGVQGALPAQARAGVSRAATAPWVGLGDVTIDASYMPALSGGLGQLERLVARLDQIAPRALRSVNATASSRAGGAAAERLAAALGSTRIGQATPLDINAWSEAIAEAITRTYEDEAVGAPAPVRSWQSWGEQAVLLAPERAAARPEVPATPEARERLLRALGAVSIADIRHLAAPAARPGAAVQATGAPGAVSSGISARAAAAAPPVVAAPALPRHFQLFSAEKVLAMIAPQLESGGLLDATSRHELTNAVRELASTSASSAPARRVRTPFGTLSVKLEGGRVVVDAEEISSAAPSVKLSTAATSAPMLASWTSAPTAQAARFEALASRAGVVGQPSALRAAEALRASLTAPGVAPTSSPLAGQASAPVRAVLGAASRAERLAADVAAPVGRDLRVQPFEVQLAALERAAGPQASTQVGFHDDLIHIAAASPATANLTRLLAQASRSPEAVAQVARALGIAPAELQATSLPMVRALAAPQAQPGAAPAAGRSAAAPALATTPQQAVRGGAGLERWLAHLAGPVAETFGAEEALAPSAEGIGEQRAIALAEALAEASDRRVYGGLGAVAMLRDAPARFGHLSRADLAYVLPYLQRQADPASPAAQAALARAGFGPALRAQAPSFTAGQVGQAAPPVGATPAVGRFEPGVTAARAATPGITAAAAAQPSASALAAAAPMLRRALVEAALSVGQAERLVAATRGMGVSNAVLTALLDGPLATASSISGPEGFAEHVSGRASVSEASGRSMAFGPELTYVQPGAAAQQRAQLQGIAAGQQRLDVVDRLIAQTAEAKGGASLQRGTGDPRMVDVQPTQALGGAMLRQLRGVQQVLAAIAPRLAGPATDVALRGVALPASLFQGSVGDLIATGAAPIAPEDRGAFIGAAGARASAASGGASLPVSAALSAATGALGVWLPESLQRLVGQSADAFVGSGRSEGQALVVPSLFAGRSAEQPRLGGADGGSIATRSALRISQARLDEVAHALALGLKVLNVPRTGYRPADAPGDVIGLAGTLDRISQGHWASASASQRGMERMLASLDAEAELVAPGGARSEGVSGDLVDATAGQASSGGAPVRAPERGRSDLVRALFERAKPTVPATPTRVQGASVADKGALFVPFVPPQAETGAGEEFAPRASTGGSNPSGPTTTNEGGNKSEASQANLPSMDDLEETAHEVWQHIKRLIALEFERRGIDP